MRHEQLSAGPCQRLSRCVPLTIDMVYGSLWYRLIFAVGPLDYGWADEMATATAPPG
jgi:hypothetical protein